MANSDQAQYTLRYNEITGDLEAQVGLNWITLVLANAGSGITQLHGDVAAGPGTGNQAATLATVNTDVGSFTSANITINAKGLITAAANGSGGASPNVVMGTDTAQSTTSTSPAFTTTTTVTITPSSNTAKIKITAMGTLETSSNTGYASIQKDGVEVASPLILSTSSAAPASMQWLDTPGDTLPHTYAVSISAPNNDGAVNWGGNSATNVIIAEEIH